MIVGIDFDNTLVSFDTSIRKTALRKKLLTSEQLKACADKTAVRDLLRQKPNGDLLWQEIQAEIYGPAMMEAEPMKGAYDFLSFCSHNGVPFHIVSHKTDYSALDIPKAHNLRAAAMEWMRANRFFSGENFAIDETRVHFASSRDEKIEKIQELGCTHFIDDLVEVLSELPQDGSVRGILYQGNGHWEAIRLEFERELARLRS